MAPLLSIVTVVRNDRAGLAATRSSLSPPIEDGRLEWLVADGGSDDDTLLALAGEGLQPRWLDSRPDGGPFAGMDRALAVATGGHVLFLNAGDQLAGPGVLPALLALLGRAPAPDLLYGDAAEDPGDGHYRHKPARHWRWAFYGMPAHHCAILYRRTLLTGLRFDQGYRIAGDYAVTVESLARAGDVEKIGLIIAVFAPGGLSRRHAALGREEQALIRQRQMGMPHPISATITMVQIVADMARHYIPKWYALSRFGHRLR